MLSKPKLLTSINKEDLEESFYESTHSDQTQFLNRKTKRSPCQSNRLTYTNLPKDHQCDICLDYAKYTTSEIIKCITCDGQCHQSCYEDYFSSPQESQSKDNPEAFLASFQCLRCKFASNLHKTPESIKCLICAQSNGILSLMKDNQYTHLHCIKFIKELIENESMSNDLTMRKWRFKSVCKICKEKGSNDKAVIKCLNSKCNCYYHLPCAIEQGLIYPIDFQYDFYGIRKEYRKNYSLPFYCSNHNKNIAKEYEEYIKQMESFLGENNAEDEDKEKTAIKEEEDGIEEEDYKENEVNPLKLNFDTWFNDDLNEENENGNIMHSIFNDDYQKNDFFVLKFDEF